MEEPIKILLVEDTRTDAELELRELRRAGLRVEHRIADTEEAFRREIEQFRPDVILSDFSMPAFNGMAALGIAREIVPYTPFIFVSGTIGEEYAIRALKNGAIDYVLKTNLVRLPPAVERALQDAREAAARRAAEEAVRESEERFRGLLEFAPDAMVISDRDGKIVLVNAQTEALFGYPREELLGQQVEILLPERFRGAHVGHRTGYAAAPRRRSMGERLDLMGRRRDGSEFPVAASIGALEKKNGDMLLSVAVRDMTVRRENERRIARLNRVYAVLSGINTAIVRTRDRQELFDEACRIAVEQGGFRFAWIGLLEPDGAGVVPVARAGLDDGYLDVLRLSALDDAPDGLKLVARVLREKAAIVCNDIDADPRMARWREEALRRGYRSLVVFPLQVGEKVLGVLLLYAQEKDFFDTEEMSLLTELAGDISFALDHLEKEKRLDYLAYYDILTGLPNRALLRDRLAQRTGTAHQDRKMFAVMLLDLERFRIINETLGQHAGDELLRRVGRRLQDGLDETDILARPGANSFAIVTRRADDGVALAQLLEQILFHLHGQPFEVEGKELRVVAKAGVAVYPGDGEDADILYRNAEAALEKAKRSGERYLFYAPEFNARVAEKLTLENKLRRALEHGELVLHYQPKIELGKRCISGLEALMRWNDPDTGLVPPFRFISILEETGLILDAGRWALEQTVAESGRWKGDGLTVPRIAVNVSPIQLRQKDFVATVERALDGAGEGILELEITESLIMQDIETNIQKLRAVRDMGVEVTVDDFGTGYSSLSYIARLPIGSLKIDRAFIMNMTSNPDDVGIVSTIISLGHSLRLKVVAEGVETEEQANLLRLLKCDEFQGYLFSPAVPAEQVELLLRENRPPPR